MPEAELMVQETDPLRDLMAYIMNSVSPDWDLFDFSALVTGSRMEYQLVEVSDSGQSRGSMPPPEEIVPLIARLRAVEYSDVQGAWFQFRARALQRKDGKVHYYRTDDIEPRWQTEIPPTEDYRADLARFPRPAEQIAAWLSARLEGRPVPSRPVFAIDDPLVAKQDAVENAYALGSVVDYLVEFAPLGWRTLFLGIRATGSCMELTPTALLVNGAVVEWELPTQVYAEIREFREADVSPINPWLSFQITVYDDTRSEGHAEFNTVPDWEVPPTSADYYSDMVRIGFPLDKVVPTIRQKYEQALAEAPPTPVS